MLSSRTKSLLAAFFILFLDNFGYALAFPLFPAYILNPQFGILPAHLQEVTRHICLGIVLIAFPCAQLFGAPLFGGLSDRFGRKRVLKWTISGTFLGYLLTASALLIKSYLLLIAGRLLTGFFAANLTICMAILADMHFGKMSRSRSFGYVAGCVGAGWVLALVGGLLLAQPHIPPSLPFWPLGILSLLSLALLTLYRETLPPLSTHTPIELLKGVHQLVHLLEHKQMRTLLLTLALWFFGFFIAIQWAAPISIEKFQQGIPTVIKLLTGVGLLWTLGGWVIHTWLVSHASCWKISIWSLFCVGLLYFFGGTTDFFLYYASALALTGLFAALVWSSNMSLISLAAPSENQGKALGMAQGTTAATQCVGALLGGIAASFSLETLYFTSSLFVLAAFLLLLVYVLRRKQHG